MDLRPDRALAEVKEEGLSALCEPCEGLSIATAEREHVEVIRAGDASGAGDGGDEGQQGRGAEGGVVAGGERAAAGDEPRQLGELAQAERALEIGDAVVEAEGALFVVPGSVVGSKARGIAGDAVGAELAELAVEGLVVGEYRAALARRDVLDRVERERGHVCMDARRRLQGAFVVSIRGSERVSGVFDDHCADAIGDGADVAERGDVAGEVDGQDDLGTAPLGLELRDAPLERGHGEEAGVGLDIDKHGLAAGIADGVCGGDEGDVRGEADVGLAHAGCEAGEVQRGGAIGDGDGVASPCLHTERLFEALHARPLGQPVAAEGLDDGGDVVVVDGLSAVGEQRGAHHAHRLDSSQARVRARPSTRETRGLKPSVRSASVESQQSFMISACG